MPREQHVDTYERQYICAYVLSGERLFHGLAIGMRSFVVLVKRVDTGLFMGKGQPYPSPSNDLPISIASIILPYLSGNC